MTMRHATVTGTNRVLNLRQRFIGESRLNTSLRDTPEACVRERTGETTYSRDYIIARRLVDLMSYRFLLIAKDELSTDYAGFTLGIVKWPTRVWNLRNPWIGRSRPRSSHLPQARTACTSKQPHSPQYPAIPRSGWE